MRMLCMNDDTHEDFYVDENGKHFDKALDLLKWLSKQKPIPNYEVRLVYLADISDCNNEGCTVAETDAFSEIQEYDSEENIVSLKNFKESFNILWEVAIINN